MQAFNLRRCSTGARNGRLAARRVSCGPWRLPTPDRSPPSQKPAPLAQCRSSAPSSDAATQTSAPDAQHPSPDAPDSGSIASLVGSAWDPEGLFGKSSPLNFAAGEQMGDLIARRERERAARRAAAAAAATATAVAASQPPAVPAAPAPHAAATAAATAPADRRPVPPLPAGVRPLRSLAAAGAAAGLGPMPEGGWRPAELPAGLLSELDELLRRDFMPVDLSWPGLRVVHLDPPVITVEGFLPDSRCEQMVEQAEASGRMQASRIGASNVAASYGNASSTRRTSTGMMVTPGVAGPVMDTVVSDLQSRGKRLLRAGEGPAWGIQGKLPRSGQFCYEALQVARYDRGQHFLAHEDGFPPAIAAANGFQRHATLLVYLNDVPEGGATRFDYLDLAVRPRRGRALLFFPAFLDGTSDIRSLHTAEDAVDVKYVTQQWIARGLPQQGAAKPKPAASVQQAQDTAARRQEAELEQRERVGRQAKSAKVTGKAAGKGFGSKASK